MKSRINDLEAQTANPEFWNDKDRAEAVMTELKTLRDKHDPWVELVNDLSDADELFKLAVEEGDAGVADEIQEALEDLSERYEKLRFLELLSGEFDAGGAYLTIHSGAGGTEACDWVSMLLRMYSRWIERRGFKSEVLDIQEAEGGIKSVTLEVSGSYAFGFLLPETGVHRLVRISPFDSAGRRHTSFASVYCSPVVDDDIDVEIKPEDLRVDTYRSGGAGGQHVNTTDSAIRLTHLATGIVVQCQNERSQHKNRATAMKMLKSRLYQYYKEEQDKEAQSKAAEKKDISWGNQIRSYVFHPYTMVKDHRTKKETGNIDAVMDGRIDEFIEEYLRVSWQAG